jgi:hypothetical protein
MTDIVVTVGTHEMSTAQAAAWRKLWAILLAPETTDAVPPALESVGTASVTIHPLPERIGDAYQYSPS